MDKYRTERLERLFHELKYEITRGIMEHDIEPIITYQFCFPLADEDGQRKMLTARFETRIVHPDYWDRDNREPLQLVKK